MDRTVFRKLCITCITLGISMTLFCGCGDRTDSQMSSMPEEGPVHEGSTEWEQLYDRWQEGACETAFSLGTEIYSVGVARRCGQDSGAIAITYQFSLDADEKEEAVRLLGEKERTVTNDVLKAVLPDNSITFTIADDSGCVKEVGIPAASEEGEPLYFTVSYLFPYRGQGDVRMSFAGELSYEEWQSLARIVEKGMASREFDEIDLLGDQ